jgi:hypothetical protein
MPRARQAAASLIWITPTGAGDFRLRHELLVALGRHRAHEHQTDAALRRLRAGRRGERWAANGWTPAERQREGIAKAKAAGKYKGRPVSIDAAQIRQLRGELGPTAIAKRLGIARSSVYRVLGA